MTPTSHVFTIAEKREYIKCATNEQYFIESYCKLRDKQSGNMVPVRLMLHQVGMLKGISEHQCVQFFKYRQAGASTLVALHFVYQLVFGTEKHLGIAAHNYMGGKAILQYIKEIIDNLPDFLRPKTDQGGDTSRRLVLENRNAVQVFNISRDGIRGYTCDEMYLDEFMYAEHLEAYFISMLGSLSVGSRIIGVSSPRFGKCSRPNTLGPRFATFLLQWYCDERFNKDLRWERVMVEDGEDVGVEIRRNVKKEKYGELLKQGFKPFSAWSDAIMEDSQHPEQANITLGEFR